MRASGLSYSNASFAPFRRRLVDMLLDVALLRLRACLVADNGIIANLTFLRILMMVVPSVAAIGFTCDRN